MGKNDEQQIKALASRLMKNDMASDEANLQARQTWYLACKIMRITLSEDDSSDEEDMAEQMRSQKEERRARNELEDRQREDKAMYYSLKKFSGDPDELRRVRFDKWLKDFQKAIRRENWTETEIENALD